MSDGTIIDPVPLGELHWLVYGSDLDTHERRELAQRHAADLGCVDADGYVSRYDAHRIADIISWSDADGVYRGFAADNAVTATTRRKYLLELEGDLYRLISTGLLWGHKKGQRGGLVQSHLSLAHTGNCWVDQGARVLDMARVIGDARLLDDACISGRSLLAGNAAVHGTAAICDRSVVDGMARVRDSASLHGSARATDNAILGGHVLVRDGLVGGDTVLNAEQRVGAGAVLLAPSDVLHLSGAATPWGAVTAYATVKGHAVQVGCQTMTVDTLAETLTAHGNNTLAREMLPGFVAMLAPMIERWALSTDDRAELALRVRTIQD